jgi:hypothetical protein
MCDRAAFVIARKAILASLAEADLVEAINAEVRVHRGVVQEARAILLERGDRQSLELLDGVTERDLDVEQARALVESAGE